MDAIADAAYRRYIFRSRAGIGTLLRHTVRWGRAAKSGMLIFCDQRSPLSVSPPLYLMKYLFDYSSCRNSGATAMEAKEKITDEIFV